MVFVVLLAMPRPSAAVEPGARPPAADASAPASSSQEPSDASAGAATLESNRQAIAQTVADTAALAAYQQQLAQFRAQQAEYRRQAAEVERQTAAYKALQEQYIAQVSAMKHQDAVIPEPKKEDSKDDVVTCQDVTLTGSRASHKECHTRREWRTMQ